jgi:hypothetical protein
MNVSDSGLSLLASWRCQESQRRLVEPLPRLDDCGFTLDDAERVAVDGMVCRLGRNR